MRFRSKLFSILITGLMIISSFNLKTTIEALEVTTDVSVSKDLEVTNEDMDIVFTLPVQTQTEPIDVVFVMDKSFNDSNMRTQLGNLIREMNAIDNDQINVAVIDFRLDVVDRTGGLVRLSDNNVNSVVSAISLSSGEGSNLHSALIKAKALLDASPTLDSNKHIILASDFAGNKTDSGDGNGRVQFVNEGTRYVGFGDPLVYETPHFPNNHDMDMKYSKGDTAFFNALTTGNIDALIRNETLLSGTVVTSTDSNYRYLTTVGESVGEYLPDSLRSGDKVFTSAQQATMPTIETLKQTSFPTMLEKNIYLTGNLLLDMKESGYNLVTFTKPYTPRGFDRGNRFEIIANFYQEWFERYIGTRFHTERGDSVIYMVSHLKDETLYQVARGEIVDIVDSRFKVVKEDYNLLLNDVPLAKTQIAVEHYGFGTPTNGVYPYEMTYIMDVATEEETITWKINVPANNFDELKMKFGIELKTMPTQAGIHVYDTNKSADLNYLSTQDVTNGEANYTKTQAMPSPQVTYVIGSVTAEYVDEAGNSLLPSVTTTGEEGTPYSTIQEIISGYDFVEVVGNPRGNYGSGNITVTYVYKNQIKPVTTSTVTVNYEDEAGNVLSPQVTVTGNVGDPYVIDERVIQNYELIRIDGDKFGNYTSNQITVTYVYREIVPPVGTSSVIVKYVDDLGNVIADQETILGLVGESYTTVQKAINGYEFIRVDGTVEGIINETPTTVTYIYKQVIPPTPTSTVTVVYVDEYGKEIASSETLTGEVGDPYTSFQKSITGYEFVRVDGTPRGNITETPTTVTYIYKQVIPPTPTSTVTVIYVDENGKEIASSETLTGKAGDPYAKIQKAISDYEFVRAEGKSSDLFSSQTILVRYIYKKINEPTATSSVIVRYVDENGNEIAPSRTINGSVGSSYSTQSIIIDGYELVRVDGNNEGTLKDNAFEVVYVYRKRVTLPATGVQNNLETMGLTLVSLGFLILLVDKRKVRKI